jgi:hypothetical protein
MSRPEEMSMPKRSDPSNSSAMPLDLQDTPYWEASTYARTSERRSILDDLLAAPPAEGAGVVKLLFFNSPASETTDRKVDMDEVWSFGPTPLIGCFG